MIHSSLLRRSPLKAVNKKRRAELRAIQFAKQAEYCRNAACCVCFTPGPSHPHHVRSRGAGGLDADTVPLCPGHHAMVHAWGCKTFAAETGIDLRKLAERIAKEIAACSGMGSAAGEARTRGALLAGSQTGQPSSPGCIREEE